MEIGRQIRSHPRAEDEVDEHRGLENAALLAQTFAAGIVVFSACCGRPRINGAPSDKTALHLVQKLLRICPSLFNLLRIAPMFERDLLQNNVDRVFGLETAHD